jgi:TolA-binding protein
MAQKDGIIRNLEHQLRERDQEIERLTSETQQEPQDFQKMKDLEMKVVEMESMIKGLTEELLDLKSVVRKLVRVQEEREVRERNPPAPMTISRQAPKPAAPEPAQAKPEVKAAVKSEPEPESVPEPARTERHDTVMIMQADGTLKPEERHAEGMIIASNRPGFPQKNSSRPSSDKIIIGKREVNGERGAKAPLIYAEDEEKS